MKVIKIEQACCEKPGIKWYKLRWIFNKDKWINAIHYLTAWSQWNDDARWDPPLSGRSTRMMDKNNDLEYAIHFTNDGHDIAIGYPDKWLLIIRRKTFFKIALWATWMMIWNGWCGLREWIYYKTLTKIVERTKRFKKK